MNSQVKKKNSPTRMRLRRNNYFKFVTRRICLFNLLFCKTLCYSLNLKTACEFSCSVSLNTHPKIPCDDSSVNNTCKVHPVWLGALKVLLQRKARAHIKRAIVCQLAEILPWSWCPLKAGGRAASHEETGCAKYFLRMCNYI